MSTAQPATIVSLNGIRAIAVSLVFLAHAGLDRVVPGGFGVTVFFVLSGFLITTLMIDEHAARGRVDLGAFYLRRVIRLMPPLLLMLLTTAALSAADAIDGHYSLAGFLSVLLYGGNYFVIAQDFNGVPAGVGVVWSLAVEEHFYLLYPWLALSLLRLPRLHAATLLGCLCVLVLIWRCVLARLNFSEDYLIMATDTRMDAILIGCTLAFAADPRRGVPSTARDTVLALTCVGMVALSLTLRDPLFRVTMRYTLQGAAVAGLLYLAVLRAHQWSFRWLNWQPLVWLGTVSYSVYLAHHVILLALHKQLPQASPLAVAFLAAGLTLAIAELMRRYVEEPCAQMRRRLHEGRRVSASSLVAEVLS